MVPDVNVPLGGLPDPAKSASYRTRRRLASLGQWGRPQLVAKQPPSGSNINTYQLVVATIVTLIQPPNLLDHQGAVRAVICLQFPDLLISPTHTTGVKSIFALVALYHETHGSSGLTHTILIPFAFATLSLSPLALRCLKRW